MRTAQARANWLPSRRARQYRTGRIQLMAKILIRCDEQIKPCGLSGGKELAVEKLGPTALPRSFNIMRCQPPLNRERHALVEENPHQTATRLRSACRRTSSTCSRVTPSYHSRKSLTVAPASRFSNNVATGKRVPLNTNAPLTRPGTRSTDLHSVQSSM